MPKCRNCGKKFTPKYSSTEKCCSPQCAYEYLQTEQGKTGWVKQKVKAASEEKKKARKAKRDLDRNTLSWQLSQTQKVFNKMRRLQEFKWFYDRGEQPSCISCGRENMDWACGHFVTAGSSANLRFEAKNTYLQCNTYCNMHLSGNRKGNKTTRGYEQGLRDRFGDEKGNEIIEWCENNQHKTRKYTCDELEKMRARFNVVIRTVEAELRAKGLID